ncbi:MAG: YdaU family protein [Proteobacteria bacterium]|nr:YdaU family protein [Pseudomonadota bacterium]
MTRPAQWFKFDCRAWLDGTRDLDPEIRGIYVDVLCLIYDRDGPLPEDDGWMAHQLHVSRRKWRAAREILVACGKLVISPSGLTNKRAEFELENRAERRRINAENGSKKSRTNAENSKNESDINKTSERIGEQNLLYACGRERSESESDSDLDTWNGDQGNDGRTPPIPRGWRTRELEFLHEAAPAEPLTDLVKWLWRLEDALGVETITAALDAARPRIQAGDVKHVVQYISHAAQNLHNQKVAARRKGSSRV